MPISQSFFGLLGLFEPNPYVQYLRSISRSDRRTPGSPPRRHVEFRVPDPASSPADLVDQSGKPAERPKLAVMGMSGKLQGRAPVVRGFQNGTRLVIQEDYRQVLRDFRQQFWKFHPRFPRKDLGTHVFPADEDECLAQYQKIIPEQSHPVLLEIRVGPLHSSDMLMVPVNPENSERRMELPNGRSYVLTYYRLDILVNRVAYQKNRIRLEQIDVADEFSEPSFSDDRSQVDIGSRHDMENPAFSGSLRESVFQFPYYGTVGIVPATGRHGETRRSENQPYEDMVLRMYVIQRDSEKVRHVKKNVYREDSQHQIRQHAQPKRSDPKDEGNETVFVIPFRHPGKNERRRDEAKSCRIQLLKNGKSFQSRIAVHENLPIQNEIESHGKGVQNNEFVDGSAPERGKENGDLAFWHDPHCSEYHV